VEQRRDKVEHTADSESHEEEVVEEEEEEEEDS
jgi:hypothetical protein